MPSKTNNLRDKLEENQLDLSLMQFTEVPVKEIVSAILHFIISISVYIMKIMFLLMNYEVSFLSISDQVHFRAILQ